MTSKLALYLRAYKAEREWYYKELERQLDLDGLVFTSMAGKPVDSDVIGYTLAGIATQGVLSGGRFHDLRRTFASLMVLRGVKPKVISEA